MLTGVCTLIKIHPNCVGVDILNARRAYAAMVIVLNWFVSMSVCLYHVLCDYAQRDNKTAIPTGSSLH